MLSQQIETDKVYHRKVDKILLKKKQITNLFKFFLGWSNSTRLFHLWY